MPTYEIHPAGVTDVGNVRPVNQDHLLLEGQLVAVADGMGDGGRGERASRLAVQTLKESFATDPSADGLVAATRAANRTLWVQAETDPALRGMGTTIAAVALVTEAGDDQLAVVNVGDSRAYLLRDGQLSRVSSDHSMVADLVRAGELTEEGARTHPMRHVLTSVLGLGGEVEPHLNRVEPVALDRLLLCSDGLFNELPDEEIATTLTQVAEPDRAAYQLIQQAKAHGGNDNITAVVVDIG